jgi:hypothetical protein
MGNNEKNTQNVQSSYKCGMGNNEKHTQNVPIKLQMLNENNEKNTQNVRYILCIFFIILIQHL